MKSSIFLAATSAVLAMAGPVEKRAIVTDVVYEYITVTVTGDAPASTSTTTTSIAKPTLFVNGGRHSKHFTPVVVPTTTTTTAAAVVETTPTEAVEEPTTTTTPTEVYEVSTAPAATTATAVAATPSDMASTALYAHNVHRANHSAPEMSWLDEIATYAQTTAETCVFAHDMNQGNGGYGQNIAMFANSDNAAALGESGAIGLATHDFWYNGEVNGFLPSYYGADTPDMSNFESWGHFSQLVWADSTSLGCYAKLCVKGTMYDDMDAWYMVCNYRPAGNMGGSYGANINKPLGEPTVTN